MVPSAPSRSISLTAPRTAQVPEQTSGPMSGPISGPISGQRRRRRPASEPTPLGSLLQQGSGPRPVCPACGTAQLTMLSLVLTDGTNVRFTSCRGCEHRRWDSDDEVLSIAEVLDRSRR